MCTVSSVLEYNDVHGTWLFQVVFLLLVRCWLCARVENSTVASQKYAPLFAHHFEAEVGRGCLLENSISHVHMSPTPPGSLQCYTQFVRNFVILLFQGVLQSVCINM